MKKALRLAVPAVLAAAGILALLLAIDVHLWQGSLPRDDVRFRANPFDRSLWREDEVLPFGLARQALGVDDDITFRQALRLVRLSHPHDLSFFQSSRSSLRGESQIALLRVATSDPEPRRRSLALNLLGGLGFAAAAADETTRVQGLQESVAAFQAAIGDNPANDDAKYNLELALSRLHAAQAVFGPNQSGANSQFGKGAGAGEPGTGY